MRNILGDRDIEWNFVRSNMPSGCGSALDFGPGGSSLASEAVKSGYAVVAVDLDDTDWHSQAGVTFVHGDIFEIGLPGKFDLVIACSTLEHVGIPGRYGVTKTEPDDLDAMRLLREKMNSGAILLLTVPLGRDADFAPLCRVYGEERLPKLLADFTVTEEKYYVKSAENAWTECDRETAVNETADVRSWDPSQNLYALGCFVLRKP